MCLSSIIWYGFAAGGSSAPGDELEQPLEVIKWSDVVLRPWPLKSLKNSI